MTERPSLDKIIDSKTFRNFYYLKEELIAFCRNNKLSTSGGKIEITERIAYFLDTGKKLQSKASNKKTAIIYSITENSEIENDFVCSEHHRAFFADNQGKSLEEAIMCWKYKKQLPGHNQYERTDLVAIEGQI